MGQSRKLGVALLSAALLTACGGANSGLSSSTPSSVTSQSVRTQAGSGGQAQHRAKRANQTMTYLHSFGGSGDGFTPYGPLLSIGGTLYGTTLNGGPPSGGTVYAITPSGTESVLHAFTGSPDGQNPYAGLTSVNGTLYGATLAGGAYGQGTVYSISPTPSGTETVLQSFYSGSDGADPIASLIANGSTLYGTTSTGGVYNQGTVFSMTTSGAETVLHSFGGSEDGTDPVAPLLNVGGTNGKLYGTTLYGGANGCGTVFAVTKSSGAETVLHSFNRADGCNPRYGALIMLNGTLYGTTENGGGYGCYGNGCGTVYSITTSGTVTVLHSFSGGTDGTNPYAGLAVINGTLYGTTSNGGARNQGTIFSITPMASGTYTVVWNFGNPYDGAHQQSDLIVVNGTFYGTTVNGGANNQGTVFSLSL
jgi:uncharacterized repeat protein (TIGR03803 family)